MGHCATRPRPGRLARAARSAAAGGDSRDRERAAGPAGQHARPDRSVTSFFDAVTSQRRALALVLAAVLVLGGWAAIRLPNSILPEVVFPRITVLANAGELPSDAMMRAVTRPLEESIRRVPGVLEVRSTTSRGSAEINLDCAWDSDM